MGIPELLDQLTLELAKHTQMLKNKQFSKEYEECKKAIAEINKVIKYKMTGSTEAEYKLPSTDSELPTLNSEL